jgi:phosphoglycolate phosphatase
MNFDSIVFDLDGTLWDTCSACSVAWNNVTKRNNIEFRKITATDVRNVTGKPHEVCIRETFVGLSEQDLQVLITETMTEDNFMVEQLGGEIYPDVGEGLATLSKRYALFIVSNCQTGYIETFLKFSGFQGLFKDYECWGNTNKSKSENLRSIITRNSLKNPVMVGDMESDLMAAQKCAIPFFYMKYGFGEASSFQQEFDSFHKLSKFLGAVTR